MIRRLCALSVLSASLLLAGCTSSQAPVASQDAGLLTRDTRMCVVNDMENKRKIKVEWTMADSVSTANPIQLKFGESSCGTGYSTFKLYDVVAEVTWGDGDMHYYAAGNQSIGYPQAWQDPDRGTAASQQLCGPDVTGPHGEDLSLQVPCSEPLVVDHFVSFAPNPYHTVVIGRSADSADNIELTMSVRK